LSLCSFLSCYGWSLNCESTDAKHILRACRLSMSAYIVWHEVNDDNAVNEKKSLWLTETKTTAKTKMVTETETETEAGNTEGASLRSKTAFVLVFACQLCLCVFYNFLPCLCPSEVCTFNRRLCCAYLLPFCSLPRCGIQFFAQVPPPFDPLPSLCQHARLWCSLQVSVVSLTCLRSILLAWLKVAVAVAQSQ